MPTQPDRPRPMPGQVLFSRDSPVLLDSLLVGFFDFPPVLLREEHARPFRGNTTDRNWGAEPRGG